MMMHEVFLLEQTSLFSDVSSFRSDRCHLWINCRQHEELGMLLSYSLLALTAEEVHSINQEESLLDLFKSCIAYTNKIKMISLTPMIISNYQ